MKHNRFRRHALQLQNVPWRMEGRGVVKVTAFGVKHSSSWEAMDVSLPTAFSEQNRRSTMPDRASVRWGGFQMAGAAFQHSRGLA